MPSLNKIPSWLPILDLQPCTARLPELRSAAQRTAVRTNQGVACLLAQLRLQIEDLHPERSSGA